MKQRRRLMCLNLPAGTPVDHAQLAAGRVEVGAIGAADPPAWYRPPMSAPFRIHRPYEPQGDQPQAIEALVKGVKRGDQHQVLLGVTGSGKTYTIANVIAQIGLP